ncbi:hypothetical protein AB0891_25670 [Streptomyces sp. NPDC007259]|uniref:phage tail protein n=1 Tax=Streptomyces sp. NPDC007259 TaxID=3154319 RepID=UPI0034524FC1
MASQAEVDLIVNATRTLPDLERDLDRVLRAAQADMSDLDVDAVLNQTATLRQLDRDLDQVIRSAQASSDDVTLQAALNQQASVRRMHSDLDNLVRQVNAPGAVDPALITAALNIPRSLTAVRHDLDTVVRAAQATAPDIDIDVDVDRNLTRNLLAAAGGVGAITKNVTALSTALGAAAPLLASLATSVQNILPASAVATQGILAMVLATNTLKLGMIGVSDAISDAFDPETKPEDLEKSLKTLAPEARKFVRELIDMKDKFKDLQLGVQNRLFKDFDEVVAGLADTALPQVRTALNSTATTLNKMGVSASLAAARLSRDGTLGKALDSATTGIRNLADVPALAVTAFGQLAAAAGPSFDRITKALGRLAESAAKGLSEAFESGALQDSIEDAIGAVRQLGRVFGNVFAGIGNIIGAVSVGGDGLFGTLERVTQAFEDLTASKEFQAGLKALAETSAVVSETALPLLAQALKILGSVLVALSKPVQEVVKVLGESLGQVLDALEEPLIAAATAFGSLIVALSPLITLAGDLISAVLPALTPLFESLGRVIEAIAPVIAAIAGDLSALLVPVLSALGPVLEILLPPFAQLAEDIFPLIADALVQLTPSFQELGVALGNLLIALAPIIPIFVEFIDGPLTELIEEGLPGVIAAVELFVYALTGLVDFITGVAIPLFLQMEKTLTGDFSGAWEEAGQAVENFKGLVHRVLNDVNDFTRGALGTFVTTVATKGNEAADEFVDGLQGMVTDGLVLVATLPQRIVAALGDLGHLLYNQGARLIGGFVDGIESKIGAVTSTLAGLTSKLPDWKGPAELDARILTPSGELLIEGLIAGIQRAVPRVRAELQGLTGQLPAFGPRLGGIAAPAAASAAPVIHVSIGNEAVDKYVTVRADRLFSQRARTASQGVRF